MRGFKKGSPEAKAFGQRLRKSETYQKAMQSESRRDKIAAANRERWADPVWRAWMTERLKSAHQTDEARQHHSAAMSRRWNDPTEVEKLVKYPSPNGEESWLLNLVSHLGFDYSGGGGSLLVESKRPDFWDGGTKVIEWFGDYWHQNDDPQDRIDLFARNGYDCLVIYSSERSDMAAMAQKIEDFWVKGTVLERML